MKIQKGDLPTQGSVRTRACLSASKAIFWLVTHKRSHCLIHTAQETAWALKVWKEGICGSATFLSPIDIKLLYSDLCLKTGGKL